MRRSKDKLKPRTLRKRDPAVWYYVNPASVDVYLQASRQDVVKFRLTRARLMHMLADLDAKEQP